jgi:acyl-CoA thioesterase
MPLCVKAPPNIRSSRDEAVDQRYPPFESIRYPLPRSGTPAQKRERQWMRARGRLPDDAKTHQSALTYMSDSYCASAWNEEFTIKRVEESGVDDEGFSGI